MKCFITGIKGFAASHLAEELVSEGYEVAGSFREKDIDNLDIDVKLYELDLLEGEKLGEALDDIKPDYIFHLAGISNVALSWKQPEATMKVNVTGTENVLKGVLNLGLKSRILFVSTADVYGQPKKLPMDEEHPVNLTSPYSKSKYEGEKLCLNYHKDHNLDVVISRSFNHIGPKQSVGFVTSDFAKQIADIEKGKTKPVMKVGNVDAERDFTDVRDMVKAYVKLIEKGKSGGVYNICSGKAVKIKDLLNMMLKQSSKDIRVEIDQDKFRPVEVPLLYGSCKKFNALTAWKPTMQLQQTLKDIVDYWRKK